jgi:hypothetical protein
LALEHLYRALDFLLRHIESLEQYLRQLDGVDRMVNTP